MARVMTLSIDRELVTSEKSIGQCPLTPALSVQSDGGYSCRFQRRPTDDSFNTCPAEGSLGRRAMLSAVANCTNTILGAGTMVEPVAVSHAGIIVYEIIVVFMFLSSYFSLRWLVAVADELPEGTPKNYEGIARTYLSPFAANLISAVFVFGGFSLTMAYMLLISKSMSPLAVQLWSRFVWVDENADAESLERNMGLIILWSVGLGMVLPLGLMRDISRLSLTSSLACISILYAAVFIVIGGLADLHAHGPSDDVVCFNWSSRIFMSMGMMISDFSCHMSTMPIYMSLGPKRSPAFMMRSITTSLCIAAIIYQLVGVISYLRFGDKGLSAGNVLNTIAEAQDAVGLPTVIANVGVSLTLVGSMPIALWPLRSVVLSIYKRWLNRGRDATSVLAAEPTAYEWTVVTCGLLFTVLTLATLFPDVKVIMSIGGSVGGTFIVFIFPAAFYISVVKKIKFRESFSCANAAQWSAIGLGIAFGILCFSSSVKGVVASMQRGK